MKTMREKAAEYVKNNMIPAAGLRVNTYAAFKAGYRTAFEWIGINDCLPKDDRAILAKNENTRTVWASNMLGDGIAPLEVFSSRIFATHWREIEAPEE
jgi:hypothetical protein